MIARYNIIQRRKRNDKISKEETLVPVDTHYHRIHSSNYYSNNSHKLNFALLLTKVYKMTKAIFQAIEIIIIINLYVLYSVIALIRSHASEKHTIINKISQINLLRWNDVPRTSRIFYPKIAIFSQF